MIYGRKDRGRICTQYARVRPLTFSPDDRVRFVVGSGGSHPTNTRNKEIKELFFAFSCSEHQMKSLNNIRVIEFTHAI
jgi:hypothetical protein